MLGIGFLDELIGKVGIPLVSKGIKALTGIDIESKELTAEDKQKIMDSQIEIMKIDFDKLKLETESKLQTKKMFLDGYEEMIKIIEPEKIFIYGREIEELKGNVKYIKPFNVNQRMKEES